jgi:hypothetical protein
VRGGKKIPEEFLPLCNNQTTAGPAYGQLNSRQERSSESEKNGLPRCFMNLPASQNHCLAFQLRIQLSQRQFPLLSIPLLQAGGLASYVVFTKPSLKDNNGKWEPRSIWEVNWTWRCSNSSRSSPYFLQVQKVKGKGRSAYL